jgi:hypothetical protein
LNERFSHSKAGFEIFGISAQYLFKKAYGHGMVSQPKRRLSPFDAAPIRAAGKLQKRERREQQCSRRGHKKAMTRIRLPVVLKDGYFPHNLSACLP